jgi:hypothetical protein
MSSISAGTSSGTALVITGDTTGALAFKTGGSATAALTLDSTGAIGVGSTPGYGTNGQFLTSSGTSAAPTWTTLSAGFTLGTPVATTSGTSIDFTGIPAGTKVIIISFNLVSTSDTSKKLIQLGDSGGIESTGYKCVSALLLNATLPTVNASTAGFLINNVGASNQLSGSVIITLENATSFTYSATGQIANAEGENTFSVAGIKATSAVLDRIRLTTVNGTDTFDGGEMNIAYI